MNKNNSLEVIKDCTTYIKNHLQDTLTAESLASRYGYSLYHFCHIFKICCDMSPGKYIRLLRLEKAKKDILSGMSITQAGFDNGFETHSSDASLSLSCIAALISSIFFDILTPYSIDWSRIKRTSGVFLKLILLANSRRI